MAVTIYRSTDSGAPALPANASYVGANFYIDLLKKCLVTGYGSKSGAGWSTVYDDTTSGKRRAAFSNGNGCAEFITWGVGSVAMMIWDSITTPGSGRLYNDDFATVMSSGVNGWRGRKLPAPGIASEGMAGINVSNINTGYSSSIGWTVFADDKSAWILFHYPSGNPNANGNVSLGTHTQIHPAIFLGALKSPDLDKNQMGNFFVIYSAESVASAASTAGSTNSPQYFWGLRTPWNTVPSSANDSSFSLMLWGSATGREVANPHSSVRALIPVVISYLGSDVVKPAGLTTTNGYYQFATIPGLAQFASPSGGAANDYWLWLNVLRAAAWNMQVYSVNGVDWMPWSLSGNNASQGNFGITNDASWWA